MSKSHKGVARAVALLWLSAPLALSASSPDTRPADLPNDTMAEILGVASGTNELILEYADCIARIRNDEPQGSLVVGTDKLVDAIFNKPNFGAIRDAELAGVDLGGLPAFLARDDKRLGTRAERTALIDFMVSRSRAISASSPAAAGRYARAALLLADEEFTGNLGLILKVRHADGFAQLAEMSAPEKSRLDGLIKARQEKFHRFFDAYGALVLADDKIIEGPGGKIAPKQMADSIRLADAAANVSSGNYYCENLVIFEVWQLRSLAKDRSDEGGEMAVHDLLSKWRRAESDIIVAGWLDEASTKMGDVPDGPRVIQAHR